MRLADKVAVITGGGSGFGEGIAKRFAEEGARIVIADINVAGGQRVAEEINAQTRKPAVFVEADVASANGAGAMVGAALEQFGKLDILVNNAGWSHDNKPLMDVTEEEYDRCYAINCKAIFLAMQQAVPVFGKQGGGVVINTTSTAGSRPRPGLTWYNSTKGAANIMTKSLAVELAPLNIRVNAVAPVIGETGLLETFMGMPDTPENRRKFLATIPLGRFSKPRDIANAALYLASDEAEFITGVILEVDGGRCV